MPDQTAPFLFVHVMKVGGGSFKQMVRSRVFPPPAFYPGPEEYAKYEANIELSYLRDLSPLRREQIRFYSGHFPFVARELITPSPRVLAFLRNPIGRTISYLRQHQHDLAPAASLEEIYERTFFSHVQNHMTKVFGIASVEEAPHVFEPLQIGPDRLEAAKRAVDELAFIGIQEQFGDSIELCKRTFGWDLGPMVFRNRGRGPDPNAGPALIARIERDNALDMALYDHARARFQERFG